MVKGLLVVETNCSDVSREAEFNEWYDKIHLPDVLETSGFIRATRYEISDPKEDNAKFIAIYEIEADDIGEAIRALNDSLAKKAAEGRFSGLLVRVSRRVYKQISTRSRVPRASREGSDME